MQETSFSRLPIILQILMLFLLWFPVASALQVTGLYDHKVAVNNESDAERNRAFREALEAVILKVTGEHRWLEHPRIEEALGNAQSYIEAISYSSETVELPQRPNSATSAQSLAAPRM